MVATNIRLPNIRKMVIPDPGFVIADADLAGADAQVVAWETGDEKLKDAFKQGKKIHIVNARDVWPDQTKDMTDEELKATGSSGGYYYQIKRAVHGTNYGATYNALVNAIGWEPVQAQEFIERWLYLHPEIKEWHERTERHLLGLECWNCHERDVTLGKPCPSCGRGLGRRVRNQFGHFRTYLERYDVTVRNAALAWVPQSTVALVTEIGWTSIAEPDELLHINGKRLPTNPFRKYLVEPNSYSKWHNIVQFLIQVHDSIVFQVPWEYEENLTEIVNDMRVRIPYPDPLIIPWGLKSSRVSWGEC